MTILNKVKEKPIAQWTADEKKLYLANNIAMNAIHSALSPNQFVLVSTIVCAKTTWDALQTNYDGTSSVKVSKLQMLFS